MNVTLEMYFNFTFEELILYSYSSLKDNVLLYLNAIRRALYVYTVIFYVKETFLTFFIFQM